LFNTNEFFSIKSFLTPSALKSVSSNFVAGKPSVKITNIYADGNIRGSATFGNVSSNTAISFGDLGSSVDIATVLAPTTTSANTIQANAWITGGTIGKVADIVAQRSSRRYKLNNADGFDSCRLVPQPGGVPTVATVTSAKGPTAVGEMTIQATDSAGGTYWVSKIESRTATVHPGGTGTPGTQFAANSQPIWTSTSAPTVNVSALRSRTMRNSLSGISNDALIRRLKPNGI
jgi:hypothetical protein